jgi:hypothetical protein
MVGRLRPDDLLEEDELMPDTSLGITYPASSGHDRIWEHIQTVADDVDALLLAAPGAWQNYSPAFTSFSGSPALGNSVATGRYIQPPNSKLVHAAVRIVWGTTAAFGTGGWSFSLPVAAATNSFRVGAAYCRDTSAGGSGHFVSICVIDSSTPTVLSLFNVTGQVGGLFPFTWTSTDHVSFGITYEAA